MTVTSPGAMPSVWRSDAGHVLHGCPLLLGGAFGTEPYERSAQRLDAFAEAGGRVTETAYSYAGGRGIAAVGRWLREHPGRLDVVLKVGHDRHGEDMPLSRANVIRDVTGSLSALGTDAAAVIMLHCDDQARPADEIADTLDGLVTAGYARSVGASNWPARRLGQLADALRQRGHRPLASYHYSLADVARGGLRGSSRAADDVDLQVISQHALPLLSWSANAGGYFSRAGGVTRDGAPNPFDSGLSRARRARCVLLADRLGLTPAAVALAWVLARPGTLASVGAGTPEHLHEAFQAAAARLSPRDAAWLAEGSSSPGGAHNPLGNDNEVEQRRA